MTFWRGRVLKALVDGLGDQSQCVIFGAGRARAGVNDHAAQAERLGAIQFVDEGRDRLLTELRQGRGEIDQVAGVRHDRRQAGLVDALTKPDDFVRVDRLSEPLVRVLAEDLQGLAAMNDSAIDRLRNPAGDRHVRAYSHRIPW